MEKVYTDNDHFVWTSLYAKTLQFLPETAHKSVMDGINKLGYPSDHLPDFEEINKILDNYTDWQLVPLPDMVEDSEFIGMLAQKKYPCRTWLRTEEQFNNDEDTYDLFHDVFGHTPLLVIDSYSQYLQGLGALAKENLNNPQVISLLKRVYWHSIQFGLIEQDKTLKIYGAHLLSSAGETIYALSAGVPKYDFNPGIMMDTPYVRGKYQVKYFVIKNFDQLKDSLGLIKQEIEKRII